MKNLLALAVLWAASAAYAGDFGVQVQVELPLTPAAATEFAANPLTYRDFDLVSISAFYEQGAWGARFDLLSGSEARLGLYRILNQFNLGLIGYQSDIGLYGGYNWSGEGFFVRLRGKFLLYGTLPAPAAPSDSESDPTD